MIRRIAVATAVALALVGPSAAAASEPQATTQPDRIVLNPTAHPATSQSITWRTSTGAAGGQVQYRVAGATAATQIAAQERTRPWMIGVEPAAHHSARLTGLTPGTTYEYRVGNGAGWSSWSRFTTPGASDEPWDLLAFGDVQNGIDTVWPQVAGAAYGAHPDAEVSVFGGDQINNADESQEWTDFFDGLGEQARSHQVVTTPGNHEYSGDVLIQQYRAHFAYPSNGPAVRGEDVWYTDYKNVRIVSLNGNAPLGGLDQALWLDRILSDNPQRWTIVTFHYPMFSFTPGRDNIATRAMWLPVLERHGVDLVLQGHDHGYARGHLVENETAAGVVGPTYVVSVAGSKYYEMAPADDNNWTRNGARRAVALEQASTYQAIRVSEDALVYRSVVAATGDDPTGGVRPGDEVDAFTITKTADGQPLLRED
ncbi:calcineurin-like phosphoesterase family protein [Mumia flava]|uniref:Calcineurin-like phosphoesterase family protein n=1 Tax=Mumia flava TaxID=1348852 RepID=A0A0B2BV75_9ACTN|nr:metallophosphoesterase family protein [Mumia flava]PJJ56000.1 calcineurin-like phosphoesterase family protein [Mumia flava]